MKLIRPRRLQRPIQADGKSVLAYIENSDTCKWVYLDFELRFYLKLRAGPNILWNM